MNRKIAAFLSLLGFAISVLAMTGCNTVEGVGKDVKAGGQAIEKAADKNKGY
jgi:predicted small secreted protein